MLLEVGTRIENHGRYPTGDVTFGLGCPLADNSRHSAIIDNLKNEYNFEMVHVRQEILY
jgi:hypothetical protein